MKHDDKKIKLIPYQVNDVLESATQIPYGVSLVEAPEIWEKGEKGKGIIIALLDTGIDIAHHDLKDRIIGGRNFTDEGNYNLYIDLNGHGTHVAGTICANGNDQGITGIAPEANLLICKVLDKKGEGSYYSIIEGIKYATNWRGPNGEQVRIINMSLGGSDDVPELKEAILNAVAQGIMVVVASGNEGDNDQNTYEFGYPALYNECITIGACDDQQRLAYFSNTNNQIDIIAPGVNILSCLPINKYAVLSGTSMATPHVSGILALIIKMGEKKFKRILEQAEIYAMLVKCCCSLGYEATAEGEGLPQLTKFFETC